MTSASAGLRAGIAAVLIGTLAGCAGFPGGGYGTPGGYGSPGGYGDYPGRGRGYGMQVVSGAVEGVDPRDGRILLVADGAGQYGRSVEVWFDRGTRLFYRGQQHDPAGLERGDRVRMEVQDDGRRLWARTIEVTHNVRDGGYPGSYPGTAAGGFEAAVRHVDTYRRVIEVTRGGYAGRVEQVAYDARTRFEYRGQRVDERQLRSGDVVWIDARPSGNGWYADTVRLLVDARSR